MSRDTITTRTGTLSLQNIQVGDFGTYSVTATNSEGGSVTKTVQVLQAVAPAVNPDLPASQAILEGDSVTLSVGLSAGTGLPAPTYQWYKDGQAITGATSTSYNLTWDRGDSGVYKVAVTNKAGSVDSAEDTVSVEYAPEITTHPVSSVSAEIGDTLTFTIVAQGVPAPTYQWYKDLVMMAGETSPTLTLSGVGADDIASYTCNVTNARGTTPSSPGLLLINIPLPEIVVQPSGGTFAVDDDPVLSVTANYADSYQWKFKGASISDGAKYSGTTTATLTITDTQYVDAGAYTCEVTNTAGTVSSDPAIVALSQNAPAFVGQPSNASVASGNNAVFNVSATGLPAPTYQWFKTGVGQLSDGAAYSGTATDTLTVLAADAADEGEYYCTATNDVSSAVSDSASLSVDPVPAITAQPSSATVDEYDEHTFTVTASGAPTYEWQEETSPSVWEVLVGEFQNTLRFTNVRAASDGRKFRCRIYNGAGQEISSEVTLNIIPLPAITGHPTGATIAYGGSHTFTVTATGGGTLTYQWELDTVDIPGATSASLVLTGAESADVGSYRCRVDNDHAAAAIYSAPATLSVNGYAPVFTAQPYSSLAELGDPLAITCQATGQPAPTFQWQWNNASVWTDLVDGVNTSPAGTGDVSGATTNALQITNAQAGDEVQYRCRIQNDVIYPAFVDSDSHTPAVLDAPEFTTQPTDTDSEAGGSAWVSQSPSGSSVSTSVATSSSGVHIEIPDDNLLSFGNGTTDMAFSMGVWVKRPQGENGTLIHKGFEYYLSAHEHEYRVQLEDGGQTLNQRVVESPQASANNWELIVATYTGTKGSGNLKLYRNSVAIGSYSTTAMTYVAMENLTNVVKVGWLMDGLIHRMAIWRDVALSAAAVGELANSSVDWDSDVTNGAYTNSGDLVVYLDFSEGTGTTVADGTTNGFDGTIVGVVPSTASFSVVAQGVAPITYQWQEKAPAGSWTDLADVGVYSGTDSTSLSISDTSGLATYQYRCVATNVHGTTNSTPATLDPV